MAAPAARQGFDKALPSDARTNIKGTHSATTIPWLKEGVFMLLLGGCMFDQAIKALVDFKEVTLDTLEEPRALPSGSEIERPVFHTTDTLAGCPPRSAPR